MTEATDQKENKLLSIMMSLDLKLLFVKRVKTLCILYPYLYLNLKWEEILNKTVSIWRLVLKRLKTVCHLKGKVNAFLKELKFCSVPTTTSNMWCDWTIAKQQ